VSIFRAGGILFGEHILQLLNLCQMTSLFVFINKPNPGNNVLIFPTYRRW